VRSASARLTALQAAATAPVETAAIDTSIKKKNTGGIGGRTCIFCHTNKKNQCMHMR
jgi:hypothetical protein